MKMRWLKTIKVKYIPTNPYHSYNKVNSLLANSFNLYERTEEVVTKLQYWDAEFSNWVDVPTETVREEDK